ncbi:omega-6 fatty acid desaturase [Klebsormidium nitens]|uniref:Omega-6 fatty acid desaturase n=1 Tax=Klebsormidium nitens TaxID=105231 RepID=A0A0U9HJA1_KLENI|nr:omega-6 fatty acid desaturase [Klebsormidium nitens]|eukprot:GAQ81955.1 omega-6 fatty acid desaturase [Klebsormidium nitens]
MGRGGDATVPAEGQRVPAFPRAPSDKPPFTVGDLKRAIPPHCFKRSLLTSFSYLATDLAIIAALAFSTRYFEHPTVPKLVSYLVLWPLYWAICGSVATGVWVISHECGHQAFSDYGWVNDTVGLVFHSALLVPYFSWKYSHRRHHSNTGSLAKDEVFVPPHADNLPWFGVLTEFSLGRFMYLTFMLLAGWPSYLITNATGRPYKGWANHFVPQSPIFNKSEQFFVLVSDLALVAVIYGLYTLSGLYGGAWLFKVYGAPLLVVNSFLVLITFLQHTHPALPHYKDKEWDWLRGALATVDRDYGILNIAHHHIADTHVAHHLFSTMPHYHAQEATEAIKPVLGPYYQKDTTPIYEAMWREIKECNYVEADEPSKPGVLWMKSRSDLKAKKGN